MSELGRRFFASICLFLGLSGAMAQAQTPSGIAQSFEAVVEAIDASQFDLDTYLATVPGTDPQMLFEDLQARMTTQIYAGVLRGPQGALAASSGNS